jgi:hypothetical protein
MAADGFDGWTCEVEQGHFGHRCRKPTWLYACHVELPSLPWGRSQARGRIDLGAKTTEERRKAVRRGQVEQLSAKNRARTPLPFRDLLLDIARTARTAQTGLFTRLPAGPQRPSTTVLEEVDAGACGGEGADQGGTPALLDRAQSVTGPTHVEVRGAETRTSAAGRSRVISVVDERGERLLPPTEG